MEWSPLLYQMSYMNRGIDGSRTHNKLSLLHHGVTIRICLTAYVTAAPTHQCGDTHDSMSDEQDLAKGVPGFEYIA